MPTGELDDRFGLQKQKGAGGGGMGIGAFIGALFGIRNMSGPSDGGISGTTSADKSRTAATPPDPGEDERAVSSKQENHPYSPASASDEAVMASRARAITLGQVSQGAPDRNPENAVQHPPVIDARHA